MGLFGFGKKKRQSEEGKPLKPPPKMKRQGR